MGERNPSIERTEKTSVTASLPRPRAQRQRPSPAVRPRYSNTQIASYLDSGQELGPDQRSWDPFSQRSVVNRGNRVNLIDLTPTVSAGASTYSLPGRCQETWCLRATVAFGRRGTATQLTGKPCKTKQSVQSLNERNQQLTEEDPKELPIEDPAILAGRVPRSGTGSSSRYQARRVTQRAPEGAPEAEEDHEDPITLASQVPRSGAVSSRSYARNRQQ